MKHSLRADLHTHTYYSDGSQSPADVIAWAKRAGVELIAVTDHDTMLACDESQKLAAAAGILCARGLEVSAYAGDVKLHTLGYGMNKEKFGGFLKELYEGSLRRAEDIVFRLNRCGVRITVEDAAAERFSPLSPVHGMHIARAAVKKGYAPSPFAFFAEYMVPGKPAFSCVGRPSPEDTCGAIAAAGGFSVVAHPGRIGMEKSDLAALTARLKDCGLGGIEVYYTTHTEYQTTYFKRLAERFRLIPTGGSDTHCVGRRNEIGVPAFYADGELLKRLNIENRENEI